VEEVIEPVGHCLSYLFDAACQYRSRRLNQEGGLFLYIHPFERVAGAAVRVVSRVGIVRVGHGLGSAISDRL
jgi:hypothetical protein